ncbi:MAG: penicillin-binding protein 2 [Synergistaceae bacterium]|jgi:penicillin-binding protein 2|nr:penicillin-binding protein 2 [Synergistaceae bacterium]
MYKALDHFDFDHRLMYVRNIFIFSLLFLVAGLVYFQLVKADEYVDLASRNRLRMIRLPSPRGNIYDANGVPLAVNVRTFEIRAYPMDIRLDEDYESTANLFARHGIPMTSEDLRERVERQYVAPYRAISVVGNLTLAQVSDLVMDDEFSRRLFPSPVWRRIYPAGALAAHVVGNVGEITREELEDQRDLYYQAGDIIGKNGVELMYEGELRGTVGEQVVEVDSRGRRLRNVNYNDPQKGTDLNLTLDLAAQREALRLMEGRKGALVAMDVNDGAVKVLMSLPAFDPNPLTWGISAREWSALSGDPDKPMMNRVTGGAYPPGSIFKVVTAAALLMEKTVDPGKTTVYCPGYFRLGEPPRTFRCWRRSGHGSENILGALRDSCDVFFYQNGVKLGIDKLIEWGHDFGVGEPTGVDIPGEVSGNIAGRDWKRRRWSESWYQGDTVNYSIGQGYLLMTPMQLVRVYAAFANGGRLLTPRFNSVKKPEWRDVKVSKANMDIIRRGIRAVVASGTARVAGDYGVEVAGKTGTAQNSHGEDHAWFVGYAPADNPKYVAAALVEGGGSGSSVASPVVAQMLSYLLEHDK